MTSVHPITETVVEINEDGLRSSNQQVSEQYSTESYHDQADHHQVADQKQADALSDAAGSSFESNQSERLEQVASNPTDTVHAADLGDDVANEAANSSAADSDTADSDANESNANESNANESNANESNANESNANESNVMDSNRIQSGARSTSSKSKEQTNRTHSASSHSSSLSSSASSVSGQAAVNSHINERHSAASQQQKELSLLDKGQTIFKPLINGLTNSLQQTLSQKQPEQEQFTFTWSKLSYSVQTSNRIGLRRKKRFIFSEINGELKSNQLFGLLGPSGAGKSSLLDCLSLKRLKNVTGQIKINGKLNKYKMAYIPQHDEYFEDLTCLEILTYASRLKNSSASFEDTLLTLNKEVKNEQSRLAQRLQTFHHRVARNVLSLLGLIEQQNIYAGKLSGGQKKRLSIAQELVIKPHILFLDEPTSGLDSNSAYLCISLLNQLAKQSTPIAIVCTIHQPSSKMLALFDQIYVLSSYGQVIYNSVPSDIVSRLHQEQIEVPIHYNPVDYLLELASGEYEQSYIERMVDQVKRFEKANLTRPNDGGESKDAIKAFALNISESFNSQFGALLGRCFLLTMRNPMLTTNRILSHLLMALFIGWVFGSDVGKAADCPPKVSLLLDADELAKMTNHTIENSKNVMDNMASVFFGILVMLLGSLVPTLVTFPLEVKILKKEYFNGWYGIKPFFFARTLADLPLQLIVPFMYVAITYYLNGQLMEEFRFVNFSLIFVLTAVIAQAHGIIVSAIFSKDIMTAVYLGPISALPLLLFSGFLVRIERMPWIIRPLTYVSYMRFAFEGMIIAIYGFNRCGDDSVEQIRRVRKQLDAYFTNLMGFVEAGINCEDDWDKANVVMLDSNVTSNLTSSRHMDLRLDLSSLRASVVGEPSQKLLLAAENKTDSNGINTLFNNLLDVLFNSQLDEKGKIVPRVMQIFDLKDEFLYRTMVALTIFTIVTRVMCYYIIRYKATMRS